MINIHNLIGIGVETDEYFVAYRPCILFKFIKMKFIHYHSCMMFATKSVGICND